MPVETQYYNYELTAIGIHWCVQHQQIAIMCHTYVHVVIIVTVSMKGHTGIN